MPNLDEHTCNLYSMVVFPAESNPTINIRTSLSFPQKDNEDKDVYIRESDRPMFGQDDWDGDYDSAAVV